MPRKQFHGFAAPIVVHAELSPKVLARRWRRLGIPEPVIERHVAVLEAQQLRRRQRQQAQARRAEFAELADNADRARARVTGAPPKYEKCEAVRKLLLKRLPHNEIARRVKLSERRISQLAHEFGLSRKWRLQTA